MPISIGIPFYNTEKYLVSAIRSVFAQSYQEWELLLVDDGSSDGSLEIARSVRDPRVRVLSDGRNRKLAYRLNQITSESKHDLIARLDADDLMSPTRLAKQVAVLGARPEIDLVTAGVCSITDDGIPVGERCASKDEAITGRDLLLGRCFIVHAAMVGRKAWFMRNLYDVTLPLVQDYELWLRAFSKGDFNIGVLPESLYFYREEGNIKTRKMLLAYKNQRQLIRKYGYIGYKGFGKYKAVSRYLGKSFMVGVLALVGRSDMLLQRRNVALDRISAERYQKELQQIMQTPVPGLD